MPISDEQLERYARHVILDEVGEEGQERLLAARVLVVGAGGLGAPLALYLAAAGVGNLTIIDDDTVELSNLQRQVIHTTGRLGEPKAASAAKALAALNPEVRVQPLEARLDAENVVALVEGHDLVADGSDNFATRYLLNDACFLARKTLVSAALMGFDGQLSTFRPGREGEPCYRCLYPSAPPEGTVPRCEEAGIFGAVAGVMGSLQAAETIKEILGLGDSLSGRLLMWNALDNAFREIRVRRNPDCALCGDDPVIAAPPGAAA